jgi:hypothetical protein
MRIVVKASGKRVAAATRGLRFAAKESDADDSIPPADASRDTADPRPAIDTVTGE